MQVEYREIVFKGLRTVLNSYANNRENAVRVVRPREFTGWHIECGYWMLEWCYVKNGFFWHLYYAPKGKNGHQPIDILSGSKIVRYDGMFCSEAKYSDFANVKFSNYEELFTIVKELTDLLDFTTISK